MFSLAGKKAVVTGGASGIGRAVATRFREAGAEVAVFDLDAEGEGAQAVDVSDEAAFARAMDEARHRLGAIDILVNNAGVAIDEGPLEACDLEAVRRTLDVNLLGVLHGLKHARAAMGEGGSIINTASLAATLPFPSYAGYAASKAGVVSLGRTAALELGPLGIRVNNVLPGPVMTPMEPRGGLEDQLSRAASVMGRPAEVEDVVGVYHFLAADESRFITGQSIEVSGGFLLGPTAAMFDAFYKATQNP